MEFSADELKAPVPAGIYVVVIREVQERHSRNDNPLVEVRSEVEDGEFTGETLRDHFVIGGPNQEASRVGRRRLLRLCQLCELPIRPNEEVDFSALVGLRVVADVFEDVYRGLPVSRVRAYRRITRHDPAPF